MEKYRNNLPLPSGGINYLDENLIGDNDAAEGTVNVSFRDGIPKVRRGYLRIGWGIMNGFFTAYGSTFANQFTRLYRYTSGEVDCMAAVLLNAANTHYCIREYKKGPNPREIGDIALKNVAGTSKTNFIKFSGGFPTAAFSEKVLVLGGGALKYYDPTNTLSALPAYTPSAEEIAAWGTNAVATAEVQSQKWIINDDNRFWVAGYKNIVRISHMDASGPQPVYWPSNSVFKLTEDCTGMARYMGEVILFTENTATLVEGSTPVSGLDGSYVNKQLPGGYGCSQAETIAIGDNSLYWANKNGVYRYTYKPYGHAIPECISEFSVSEVSGRLFNRSIRKRFDAITDWTKVFAVFHDHAYRLYLGDKEELVFDTIRGTWAFNRYENTMVSGVSYGNELYYSSDAYVISYGHYYAYIFLMEANADSRLLNTVYYYLGTNYGLTDDGNPIESILVSKRFDFGNPSAQKRFRKIMLTMRSPQNKHTALLTVMMDNMSQSTEISTDDNSASVWGNNYAADDHLEVGDMLEFDGLITEHLNPYTHIVNLVHLGKRNTLQYKISSYALAQTWELLSAALIYKVKEVN